MSKLIITVALPAAGKTHWAEKYVQKSGSAWKILCKDDLRRMLDAGKYSRANEKVVDRMQKLMAASLLASGVNVIICDTNLSQKRQTMWSQFAKENNAQFERKKFLDVSVDTCIKRDLQRLHSVGEKVIRDMYKQHVAPLTRRRIYMPDTTLPKTIMVDIDNTIALMSGRSPFDWKRVGEDSVCESVAEVVKQMYDAEYNIVMMSGRDGVCRPETEKWLADNNIPYDELYMRAEGDCRKDTIIKEELFWEHVADECNVLFTMDDRLGVCQMWHSLGLKLFRIGDPDADF